MENPFDQILTRQYLDNLSPLFEADEHLDTYISALAFNVPINIADEVLLKRNIENVIKGKGDLIQVSKHKGFFTVFDSAFLSSDIDIIHTISCLNALPTQIGKKPEKKKQQQCSHHREHVHPITVPAGLPKLRQ